MSCRLGLLAVIVIGLALALPAGALAAPDTTIDFEGLPYSTQINTQYASQGVTFGDAGSFGFPPPQYACTPFASGSGAGIGATDSAEIGCGTTVEVAATRFGTSFEFNIERRQVSFQLQQNASSSTTADVTFYGIGGTYLNQQTITLSEGQPTTVSYDHGTSSGGIVGVVISGIAQGDDTGPVYLDNIDATLDDMLPPPKFSLALSSPSLNVVEGSTAQATVSVRRYNGSTGPVNLSLGTLPSGITAAQLSPATVNGTDPTTLSVTATSPFTGSGTLAVTATAASGSAGTGVAATQTEAIQGVPAVSIEPPTGGPLALVHGCGPQTIGGTLAVAGGYTGTVALHVDDGGMIGGITQPAPVTVNGSGLYPFTFSIDSLYENSGTLTITATPPSATPATQSEPVQETQIQVNDTSLTAQLPLATSLTTLTLHGSFPDLCPISVGDLFGTPQTWPVLERTPTTLTLGVPATARSGPLQVFGPGGGLVLVTPSVNVTQFRSQDGLSQVNDGSGAGGALSWDDFVNAFPGSRFVDCNAHGVCIHDPLSEKYYERFVTLLADDDGLCFGYAVVAARFARGLDSPASYTPGATRAADISPTTDGTAIKRDVIRWHLSQWDVNWDSDEDELANEEPHDKLLILENALEHDGSALVTIQQGTAGHEVVAYGITALGGGNYSIHLYDPNLPWSQTENDHLGLIQFNLSTSTITLHPDGSWSGTSLGWKGDNSTIAFSRDLPNVHTRLYDTRIIAQATGSAAISQITDGGVPQLAADGVPKSGAAVGLDPVDTGSVPVPQYILHTGRTETIDVRGTGSGSYSVGVDGDRSGVTLEAVTAAKGQTDQLSVTPGDAQLGFSTGAAHSTDQLELTDDTKGADLDASVALHAVHGANDETALTASGLTLTHSGPAETATVRLGAVGAAGVGGVQLAPMRLRDGERVTLVPRSWSDPAAGVRAVVRSASGRVVHRGPMRIVPSSLVRLGRLRVVRHGARLVVSGVVKRAGTAPVLDAVAEVTHGPHVLRTRTATLASVRPGRFRLGLRVGQLAHGARVRLTVQLIDQSPDAGLATAQRTVTVR